MNKEERINNELWDQLEQQIQLEVIKLKTKEDNRFSLHPEVIKCLNKYSNKDNNSDRNSGTTNDNDKKRSVEHDTSLDSNKHIRMGVDMGRYDTESLDVSLLQSMNSYLDHQMILLKGNGNLNKTIINQWAINNEFMENNVYVIRDAINIQEAHLKQLNKLLSMD